jgi:transcriptional regulator with XRE-family HTH domain
MRTHAMTPPQRKALGKKILKLRRAMDLTQTDLAGPYTGAYISHVEQGKRNPSLGFIAYIADRLAVSVDELLRESRDRCRCGVLKFKSDRRCWACETEAIARDWRHRQHALEERL